MSHFVAPMCWGKEAERGIWGRGEGSGRGTEGVERDRANFSTSHLVECSAATARARCSTARCFHFNFSTARAGRGDGGRIAFLLAVASLYADVHALPVGYLGWPILFLSHSVTHSQGTQAIVGS
jgi:hypothetical protein